MTHRFIVPSALILSLVFAGAAPITSAQAEDDAGAVRRPFLWVVEGPPRIYLFGTIHVPDDRVLDLPASVQTALEESDVFWAEVPMNPELQQKAQARSVLPAGESLSALLPEALRSRLSAYLAKRGLNLGAFDRLKVWTVAATLPILDILPLLAVKKPLDGALYERMEKAGKTVGGLETLDEQLGIFDELTTEQQVTLLDRTLEQLERHAGEEKSLLEGLIEVYLEGDADKLTAVLYEGYDPEDETQALILRRLLDDRNVRMVERLLERTRQDPAKTYFVAVGAAHFPGERGILALLAKAGVDAARVEAAETVPANR